MSDADLIRKPAAPLYWCGHWTSLNVLPCQSCIDEFGKQTAYYRQDDYLALVAERDEAKRDWAMYQHEVGDMLARAEAAESRVKELEDLLYKAGAWPGGVRNG